MANSDLVQSLLRGLDLLKLISSSTGGLRLSEITEITGMKKPTVHNLLRTLAARGFVIRDPENRFKLGPGIISMISARRSADRKSRAAAELLKLAEQFPRAIITLAAVSNSEILCILRVSPDSPGVVQQPSQRRFMPYISASSVVLQAMNPAEAQLLEAVYPFEEFGIGLWGNIEKFRKITRKVAQEGFYTRITGAGRTFACAMPEGYSLGFNFPAADEYDAGIFLEAAKRFRAAVWEEEI